MEISRLREINKQLITDDSAIKFMTTLKSTMQMQLKMVLEPTDVENIRSGRLNNEIIGKMAGVALFQLQSYGNNEYNLFCISKAGCTILKELGYNQHDTDIKQREFILVIYEMLRQL